MIISFDLDDTLISKSKFELEKETVIHKLFGIESLRFGTIKLFKELRSKNHKIYIYTTSFRSKARIKFMFYSYGIPVDFVINQQKHEIEVRKSGKNISKYPPRFGIDIHVDDSLGVEMEGEKYGFKTIIISEKDENWTETILNRIK